MISYNNTLYNTNTGLTNLDCDFLNANDISGNILNTTDFNVNLILPFNSNSNIGSVSLPFNNIYLNNASINKFSSSIDMSNNDISNANIVNCNIVKCNTLDVSSLSFVDLSLNTLYLGHMRSNIDLSYNSIMRCSNINSSSSNITYTTTRYIYSNGGDDNLILYRTYNSQYVPFFPAGYGIDIGGASSYFNTLYITNINGFKLTGNINASGNTISNIGTLSTTNFSTTNLTSNINCGAYNLSNIDTLTTTNFSVSKITSNIDLSNNNVNNANIINCSTINAGILNVSSLNISGSIIPSIDSCYNLGSTSYKFNTLHANFILLSGQLIPTIDLCFNIGSSSDYRWLNIYVDNVNTTNIYASKIKNQIECQSIIPSIDSCYNLGSTSYTFNNIYTKNDNTSNITASTRCDLTNVYLTNSNLTGYTASPLNIYQSLKVTGRVNSGAYTTPINNVYCVFTRIGNICSLFQTTASKLANNTGNYDLILEDASGNAILKDWYLPALSQYIGANVQIIQYRSGYGDRTNTCSSVFLNVLTGKLTFKSSVTVSSGDTTIVTCSPYASYNVAFGISSYTIMYNCENANP